jgi:CSLREA domain-containing protein
MTSLPKSIFKILALIALLLSLFGSEVSVTPAYAASLTVNTSDDELNSDGDCSLREAIQAANTDAVVDTCTAGSGADTITVPAGTYTLTLPGAGEDLNATGDLDILQDLAIIGAGAGTTIIQAGTLGYPDFSPNGIDRVFHVAGAYTVSFSNVTIANGKCASCFGGGINNDGGTLTVMNSTFSGNYGNVGGGIDNNGGTLTLTNSTFSNNSAGSGGQGGGIFNYEGNLTATNSTFSGNYANYGGAIINWGILTLINSTFAGNSAYTEGGGIYNGISGDVLTMNNSILANSTGAGKDCFNNSGTVSGSHNLIELDGSGVNACGTSAPINSDPNLAALTGSPAFFPLLPNSPAFDAGDDAICAAAPVSNTSQNGVTRPQGVHCDIGSFEIAPTFSDVPTPYWSWGYIERLYAAGITGGCGGGNYCPETAVSRGQMAVFLERGMNSSSYTPPPATGTVFGDVPTSYWSASWVEKLFADGITGGCGGGNYCPDLAVSRAQMAVFLLRAKHGSSYTPPPATGVFPDVPTSYWAAPWIEQLYAESITGGCGGGNYCPDQSVTRGQMAVFLVRTFNLP